MTRLDRLHIINQPRRLAAGQVEYVLTHPLFDFGFDSVGVIAFASADSENGIDLFLACAAITLGVTVRFG